MTTPLFQTKEEFVAQLALAAKELREEHQLHIDDEQADNGELWIGYEEYLDARFDDEDEFGSCDAEGILDTVSMVFQKYGLGTVGNYKCDWEHEEADEFAMQISGLPFPMDS